MSNVRIPIDENYIIGADKYSWHILVKRKRNNEDTWEPIKWFSSPEKAGEELFHLRVRTSGATTEFELLQAVTSSRQAIREAFKETFSLWDDKP